MENYYLILSEGAYSDYSPTYYVGKKPISKEEFTLKGQQVGDEIEAWFATLPERPYESTWSNETTEKYNPENNEQVSSYSLGEIWSTKMETWIKEQGFEELPKDIPEINVSYSEIPTSRDKV